MRHRGWGRAVLFTTLACAAVVPGSAYAQGQGSFLFLPSITFLGSFANNPQLVPGADLNANFLNVQAQLPFQFRGPRWTGLVSVQPGYQKYRDDTSPASFQNAGELRIEGRLSPRSHLRIDGYALRADDLRSQLGTDVVLPGSLQVRAHGGFELIHQLGVRDSLSISAEYNHLAYPEGTFVGNQAVAAGLGYGRALTQRFGITTTLRGSSVSFDTGNRARSVAATAGIAYRLGPRTDMTLEAGALVVQQDTGTGFVPIGGSPGLAFIGRLSHSTERVAFGLSAWRDMGFRSGLGEPTIRNQVLLSAATGTPRWALAGSGGFVRNERLQSDGQLAIDSLTGCIGGGVRLTRHVSAIGSFLFAHQVGGGVGGALDIDSYRAAVGMMLQASPPGDSLRGGSQFDLSSISRGANASC